MAKELHSFSFFFLSVQAKKTSLILQSVNSIEIEMWNSQTKP